MEVTCPTCNTEFKTPPGLKERRKEECGVVYCPVCSQIVMDFREKQKKVIKSRKEIAEALGYEAPGTFAKRVAQEAAHYPRGSGRTTTMLMEVLYQAQHRTVDVYVLPGHVHQIRHRLEDMKETVGGTYHEIRISAPSRRKRQEGYYDHAIDMDPFR